MWGSGFCGFGPFWGNSHWYIGWIFPLLFWGLIALLIFGILRDLFVRSKNKNYDNALDVLRSRFASGEINEQEYNSKRAILKRT